MDEEFRWCFDFDYTPPNNEVDMLLETIRWVNMVYAFDGFDERDKPLFEDNYLLRELLCDVTMEVDNMLFQRRLFEKEKDDPDLKIIERIKEKEDALEEEQYIVSMNGDTETLLACVNKYAAILRTYYGKE